MYIFLKLTQGEDGRMYARTFVNRATPMTLKQLDELGVSLYTLKRTENFDIDKFREAYWEGVWGVFLIYTQELIYTSSDLSAVHNFVVRATEEDLKDGIIPEQYEIKKIYPNLKGGEKT